MIFKLTLTFLHLYRFKMASSTPPPVPSVDGDQTPIICPMKRCGMVFTSNSELVGHGFKLHPEVRKVLSPKKLPPLCPVKDCKLRIKKTCSHKRTHEGNLKWACSKEGCSVRYSSSRPLKVHLLHVHDVIYTPTSESAYYKKRASEKAGRYTPYPLPTSKPESTSTTTTFSSASETLLDEPTSSHEASSSESSPPSSPSHFPIRNKTTLFPTLQLPIPVDNRSTHWKNKLSQDELSGSEERITLAPLRSPSLWSRKDVVTLPSFRTLVASLGVAHTLS
ncbi:hypothetical protein BDN72DRAFT_897432 [Pluteus cervinus]|uniref:Uncharacterized protein n=1 Tax=Pluteus cervinus TaxID=181527 RepID=A0ACD3AV39_9AGAR|nr:hypothetical protein BDN72DRAFT_897432 [Pluteus cervinus]